MKTKYITLMLVSLALLCIAGCKDDNYTADPQEEQYAFCGSGFEVNPRSWTG